MPELAAKMDEMVAVIERHRPAQNPNLSERHLICTVSVMVWQEADGTETVTVVGDSDMTPLQMKGILHDGLYTVAHEGDEARI
jgi:hypothetical protein